MSREDCCIKTPVNLHAEKANISNVAEVTDGARSLFAHLRPAKERSLLFKLPLREGFINLSSPQGTFPIAMRDLCRVRDGRSPLYQHAPYRDMKNSATVILLRGEKTGSPCLLLSFRKPER